MRNSTLCLLLFLSLCVSSQKYVPFTTDSAEWNIYNSYTPEEFQQVNEISLLNYTLRGDTIIGSTTYKKVCLNAGTNETPVYIGVGGLREQDKKIYYVGAGFTRSAFKVNSRKMQQIKSCSSATLTENNEYLLYDFNVKVGDEVNWGRTDIIDKIDSVLIGDTFRKTYTFKNSKELVIEGIGNVNSGLLGWITGVPMCGGSWNWEFISYGMKNQWLFKNPVYLDCNSTEKLGKKKYFGNDNLWYYKEDIVQGNDIHFTVSSTESLSGDTLIKGKSYMEFSGGNIGIRENNQKVYAILNNTEQPDEFLLYDFSVHVGDTIHSTAIHGTLSRLPVVTRIDTITLRNGEKRKKIYINEDIWIEGIGSLYGFFKPYKETLTCDCGGLDLISFTRNDSLIYHNTALCSSLWFCTNPVDANPVVHEDNLNVTVSPNPVINFVKIDFTYSNKKCVRVEIMNFQGQIIKSELYTGGKEMTIDLSSYRAGIYFVMIRYTDATELHKIIKI